MLLPLSDECISIHALRKESDRIIRSLVTVRGLFQSTLSVRRATRVTDVPAHIIYISIHALRKESDEAVTDPATGVVFQSTLSVRRATAQMDQLRAAAIISIHALRKESDMHMLKYAAKDIIISIHALRKESDRAAGHFCPLSETQASCLALSISNNTTGTTNNMPKTSSCLSVSF